jgi:hypothetical protein
MKKLSFLFICLAFAAFTSAQRAVITFEEKTHDFGKINEEDGKATYVFDFKNTGNAPLVVSRVQASCGCTTPTWTKQPIEPGKSGSITVSYNPAGRPYGFTKTITVYSNASEEQVTLVIKGDVVPKNSSDNGNAFPVAMGDLRLKSKIIQMNNVDKGKSQVRVIEIQNAGKSNIKPVIENLPTFLSATVSPEVLIPNQEGKITFTFNSKNCSQWGPLSEDLYLVINNKRVYSDEFQLKLIANIIEDFSKLTLDQKRKAPIMETSTRNIDLGVIKAGTKKSAKFKISNKGVNPLEIRRIINNNKELSLSHAKLSIGNGKSASISLEINSKSLPAGDYKKSFTVQTNDPDNSFIIMVVNWKVQK